MANRQLVDYIKEQLAHGVPLNQIQAILLQQGWTAYDVTAAVQEVQQVHTARIHKEHSTHYVGIAIAAIIVIILGLALFLIVFKQTEPEPQVPVEVPPTPVTPPQTLTGWEACQIVEDSIAKETCYKELNLKEENYDCDLILDSTERSFCYRAKEAIILAAYNE